MTASDTSQPSGAKTFDVVLEGAVFALIQVHEGFEDEFESWYAHDHFYSGGVLGPGVLSGRRWYAGPELRDARYVSDNCLHMTPRAGNHLAVYWLTSGGLDSFFGWVRPQLAALRAQGRMFDHRTHMNVDGYRRAGAIGFENVTGVPDTLALDHPYRGLFLTYGERPPAAPQPKAHLEPPGGALTISFESATGSLDNDSVATAPGAAGLTFPTRNGSLVMTMAFLDYEPPADVDWSRQMSERIGSATGTEPLWGGGLIPIIPGRRTHVPLMR
jgi:hypothetical protein